MMGSRGEKRGEETSWHIYLGEIPYTERGDFWVSFESKPNLEKTKANIYGRCLPCIQHLYHQLINRPEIVLTIDSPSPRPLPHAGGEGKGEGAPACQYNYATLNNADSREIDLGPAFHCWKIAAVLNGTDECLALLAVYEDKFPGGHVYGKFGSSRPFSETKVVVFHTEDEIARDLVRGRVESCLQEVNRKGRVEVSRACAVLYSDILGDWREWQQVTAIKHPEKVGALIQRIRKALFWAAL